MSAQFLEHGEDPTGIARRSNRQRLMGDDANYDDDDERSRSFVADRDANVERNAPAQQAEPAQPAANPHALDGMERALYVGKGEDGEEQFNDMWMRDNWHGRQGGAGEGLLQARGDFGGSPIEDDLLKADRGHVFDRSKPAGPAAGWDRLNQGWLGAFFGGIFGGKGRAFRNQQQAQRRKLVGDAFNRGGEMPEWVRNSRYGQRKWNQLLRAGRR